MLLTFLLFWSADVNSLSSDDWNARESSHARLESSLPLSLPLLALVQPDDPEADRRRQTLLAPYQDRSVAMLRRSLVLWLIYSPDLAEETWSSLENDAWKHRWLHQELLAYAVERGLLSETLRRRFYENPVARAWPGEKFCWRLDLIRGKAGTKGTAPMDYAK